MHPLNYLLDAPSLALAKIEIKRLIKQDLIQLDTRRTWTHPLKERGTKMRFYREHFLQSKKTDS